MCMSHATQSELSFFAVLILTYVVCEIYKEIYKL